MGDTVQGPEARRDTIRDSSSDIAQMLSLTTELASILSDPRDKSVARDRMRRSSSQIEDLLGMHEGPGPGPWGRDSDQVLFDLVLGNRIRQSIMSGGEPGQAIERRQASEFVEQNSPSRQLIEAFRQLIGAEGWGGSRDIPRRGR